jgi:glycosyltransferase involved in cell wall biosynthesis
VKIAITSLYLPSESKIGVGYQVHYLANELTRRGHGVTVFSQCRKPAGALYEVEVIESGRRLRTFSFAWRLRDRDFSAFDVLNAHGDDWFLWGKHLPRHIHTFHGSCLAEALHAGPLAAKARMFALALCEYSVCGLADELVAVSANTQKFIPMAKRVIPCGVDVEKFRPGQEKSSEPTILFVGTLHGRKRGRMLVDLFSRMIRPRIPSARLWAVCEDAVEGEGIVRFGRVPLERLVELYQRAWVFCLPSTYEGFGVPYIEAMSCGVPVVASRNVGAMEVTQDGRSGLTVSDEELAGTLIRVLENESLRLALSREGLKRSRDFSWNSVCSQYEALYADRPFAAAVPTRGGG